MKLIKKSFFFLCSALIFLVIFYCCKVIYKTRTMIRMNNIVPQPYFPLQENKKFTRNVNALKYILQWTSDTNVPFVDMGKGRDGFVSRGCQYTNCFVTSNRSYLGDYTKFDVVAFSGPELSWSHFYNIEKPELRSPHQKYVFVSIESPDNYPICTTKYDDFFNWTWTYKLNSEVQWGFVVIRDSNNKVVGPRKDMKWIKFKEMDPVNYEFKHKLKTKRKAAAWFASNCRTNYGRELFVRRLQHQLTQFNNSENYTVDVYGDCGTFVCPRNKDDECYNIIKEKYYFYLSFENSLSPDYVTEKLLKALNNDAVPIVYGGADYTRFLPEGSYLNAEELGVEKLAYKIYELMNDPDKYAEYFRWKNHYTYHPTTATADTNEYCKICALLNDDLMLRQHSLYSDFRAWWNTASSCVQIKRHQRHISIETATNHERTLI